MYVIPLLNMHLSPFSATYTYTDTCMLETSNSLHLKQEQDVPVLLCLGLVIPQEGQEVSHFSVHKKVQNHFNRNKVIIICKLIN